MRNCQWLRPTILIVFTFSLLLCPALTAKPQPEAFAKGMKLVAEEKFEEAEAVFEALVAPIAVVIPATGELQAAAANSVFYPLKLCGCGMAFVLAVPPAAVKRSAWL